MRLGEILVKHELITETQLVQALAEQKRTGEQLGELLVRRELVTRQALEQALDEQHQILLEEAREAGMFKRGRRSRGRAGTR